MSDIHCGYTLLVNFIVTLEEEVANDLVQCLKGDTFIYEAVCEQYDRTKKGILDSDSNFPSFYKIHGLFSFVQSELTKTSSLLEQYNDFSKWSKLKLIRKGNTAYTLPIANYPEIVNAVVKALEDNRNLFTKVLLNKDLIMDKYNKFIQNLKK